jgi:glycosyltransferase involved in cell wall biosynthesis
MNTQRPLRVFLTADAVGGIWQYALDLAWGLREHGIEVVLALLGPTPNVDQRQAADAAGVDLVVTGLPLDWTASNAAEIEEAGRDVARIAQDFACDVIHLNNPALAAGASFHAPVVSVCHSCVATWWDAVRLGPLPDEFLWRTELLERAYAASDMLIAPSASFAKATARIYGLSAAPTVVHNGRRAPVIREASRNDVFAFTAGRFWDEGKNFASIDRAAAHASVPVIAAGSLQGPNGTRVEACHVQSVGRLTDDEIVSYLSARPIFVSAARYEPFGLAVLEAAQAGCALILSDIPTFRELWTDAAIFLAPHDDEAIARAIDMLAHNGSERARWGDRARSASKAYSVAALSSRMISLYHSLLAGSGQRSPTVEEAAA